MKKLLLILSLVLSAMFSTILMAQNYPAKPVRLIIPYPPGGTTDILGRIIGQKLSILIGQPVVIENRIGASGNIAFNFVAKSAPDGYTLLMGTGNMTIAPAFSSTIPFNILTDFAPISQVVLSQNLLVIRPGIPATNLKELIAYAKANPGKLTYGSGSVGTPLLSIELMKSMAGLDIMQVPYKGDAPAIIDLLGGRIDMYCTAIASTVSYYRAGKLRALATTSKKRAASLPEIPTMEEAGIPGYELSSWFGILAAAGTPREIVNYLHAAIVKIVAMPDVQQQMVEGGSEPYSNTPEEFMQRIREDVAKFSRIVKAAGIKVEAD